MSVDSFFLTGFGPFAGRQLNASSIAVGLASESETRKIVCETIDVIWGEPKQKLELVKTHAPNIIISFGEGRGNRICLETKARNERKARLDVNGDTPPQPLVFDDAQEHEISVNFDARRVQASLLAAGFPVNVSDDAGQYLCDEAFFTFNHCRANMEYGRCVELAAFVHLPIFGQKCEIVDSESGELTEVTCDEPLLQRIVDATLDAFAMERAQLAAERTEQNC